MIAAIVFCSIACDVQKIGNHFEGPTKLHGQNAAIGGITYSFGDFGKDLDRHVSTCRLAEAKQGEAAVRLGTSANDLPLTIIQQTGNETSMKFQSPRGLIEYRKKDCSTLKLALLPDRPELSGTITFDCNKDENVIRGSVRFERCGN